MRKSKINLGDLIFILLYKKKGIIKGSITFQKLIDIIKLDSEFEVDASYDPYNFGDFSQDVVDVINVYVDNNWLQKTEEKIENGKHRNIFKLTDIGMKIGETVFNNLNHKDKERIKIIDGYENKNQKQILSFSYFWFPQTTLKSKIKGKVFDRVPLLENFSGILDAEYNKIKEDKKSVKDFIRESWRCIY